MNGNPLVSVVIPTYNRAGVVCETIDNVFQQTYRNFEIIVVDDGSTDDTLSKLRAYGDRLQVVTQRNAGAAAARNHGARVARGEIIAFQDSDDLWMPAKLERQVALLETDRSIPCCLCNVVIRVVAGREITSFDWSLIYPRHEEGIWVNVSEVLATRFVLFNQAVAIRREVFERIGGFDEGLKYLEDYDLPLRLSLEGPWAFIRQPLVLYHEGTPESFSQQALRDPIVLKECELRIFEQMRTRVKKGDKQGSTQSQLERRLSMLRRQLAATKLRKTNSVFARALGGCLMSADHYHMAAFRRSPWFPQPITIPARTPSSSPSASEPT
jgi:glycosyltransferase involved in cell wall biosynthesis